MKRQLLLILFLFICVQWSSAYDLKGHLNLGHELQNRIYLASINSPENLFVVSPDFIINETTVSPDGTFELSGQDLPDEPRFYRLYVVQNDLYSGNFMTDSIQNAIHLILTNKSSLEIYSQTDALLFEKVEIKGSPINVNLNQFEEYCRTREKSIDKVNTVAKRDFQTQSLNKYIRNYVSQSKDALLGLFALYHIDNRETDFLRNSQFYFTFQDRLTKAYPNHIYTSAYDNLLTNLVDYRDLVCEIPRITQPWRTWVIIIEGVVILILLVFIFLMRRKRKIKEQVVDYQSLLTDKETKIWEYLSRGMTNKEIAGELFVELSTVKTHLNNLYKRLEVSNRREAADLYNSLKNNQKKGV